jgi:hypothetical protein
MSSNDSGRRVIQRLHLKDADASTKPMKRLKPCEIMSICPMNILQIVPNKSAHGASPLPHDVLRSGVVIGIAAPPHWLGQQVDFANVTVVMKDAGAVLLGFGSWKFPQSRHGLDPGHHLQPTAGLSHCGMQQAKRFIVTS